MKTKVLITRTKAEGESFFAGHLDIIEPVYYPVFEIVPQYDSRQIHDILSRLELYHWIVFTSKNTVRILMDILREYNMTIPAATKIAAVGRKTAEAVRQSGYAVAFVPTREDGQGLLAELPAAMTKTDTEVLLPQGEAAPSLLREGLTDLGLTVTHCTLYATCPTDPNTLPEIDIAAIAWYLFTSPLSVRFFKELGHNLPDHCRIAAIGEPTAEALKTHFRAPDYVPPKADGYDIINKIRESL
ncbi:MAG: uroporphyrinogen-III synthase [candidate division Zixibacteria bacterium]|nr:uroporphyrinogen-III synthase [candidate division Zixibacteria bacterium]